MNLKESRNFIEMYLGRTVVKGDHGFQEMINFLSVHLTSDYINELEQFRVRRQRGRLLLEIKKNGWRKWKLTSWRRGSSNYTEPDRLTQAMRYSVRRHSSRFRKEQTSRRCTRCYSVKKIHVDHITPFRLLKADFLSTQLSIPNEFQWKRRRWDFQKEHLTFKKKWQKYHREHVKFQLLCQNCNLKKG